MAQKTKKKLIRVWAIVSALVLILLTVATVLTQFVMQDVLASLLGRDVAVYAEGVTPLYTTEYTNKDGVYQAANKLNERICEEGLCCSRTREMRCRWHQAAASLCLARTV